MKVYKSCNKKINKISEIIFKIQLVSCASTFVLVYQLLFFSIFEKDLCVVLYVHSEWSQYAGLLFNQTNSS